jgi:CRP-like cAMP-binding protein
MQESAMIGRWYQDEEVISRQGELGDCMYVIASGQVELIRRDGGKEFCLAVLDPGNFWGQDGLLEKDHVRSATARAIGRTAIMSIEKRMFLIRIHEDPSFVLKLMKNMSKQIRDLQDALMRMAEVGATTLK